MRILAGAVCRQHPDVLRAHLETMRWQTADAEVDLCYVNDLDIDDPTYREARDVLYDTENVRVLATDPNERPGEAVYTVGEVTHGWQEPTFHWLAFQKQRILDMAKEERYDAVWLVDTDLLCDPGTLGSLIAVRQPVVSAVFWTKWSPGDPPLPQVWLRHPYKLYKGLDPVDGEYPQHEFLQTLAERNLERVGGLGACTLISTDTFHVARYSPILPNLPQGGMWRGEDRSFCIRLQRAHIPMVADAWPDVWHCYRPSDREQLGYWLAQLQLRTWAEGDGSPKVGDYVNFTVEPLEEKQLPTHIEHVRGRLGRLNLVWELEQTILSLVPGDERIVEVNFPIWYKMPYYRGRTKRLRVKLLDSKPYLPHPATQAKPEWQTQSTTCYEAQPISLTT